LKKALLNEKRGRKKLKLRKDEEKASLRRKKAKKEAHLISNGKSQVAKHKKIPKG